MSAKSLTFFSTRLLRAGKWLIVAGSAGALAGHECEEPDHLKEADFDVGSHFSNVFTGQDFVYNARFYSFPAVKWWRKQAWKEH
jgi:hypothetical protein